jgi:hypothetical protein
VQRLLLAAACALALACVNVIDDVETPGDGPVVFGRIVAQENGKRISLGWREFRLVILPDGSDRAFTYHPDAEGYFCWELPPGDYLLAAWTRGSGNKQTSGRIGVRFSAPKAAEPLYIGTASIQFERGWNVTRVRVEDELAGVGCGGAIANARTQLMTLDEPGSFRETLPICDESWGLRCNNEHAGVVPTSPRASTSFPRPSGNAPRLVWEGVGADRFTYDLVVYESAEWTDTGIDPQYVPGRIALYKENFTEPSLRLGGLVSTLQRDSRYFWTVRLRKGDRVSTWSTHGHFFLYPNSVFLSLASAHNQLFTFSTP